MVLSEALLGKESELHTISIYSILLLWHKSLLGLQNHQTTLLMQFCEG
jgi:hypothetical protein